jgi:thioesterase domain-containing protein
MRDLTQTLEATLHSDIPITKQLGISVLHYEAETLALAAPLETNINHKGTAFAGSINAVTTLAGWGLIWLLLREAEIAARIVIQESSIKYRLPLTQDIIATCSKPAPARLESFFTMLQRKGIARLELHTQISEGGHLAVEFSGRYVVSQHHPLKPLP